MKTLVEVLIALALVVPWGRTSPGSLAASAADDPAPRETIVIRDSRRPRPTPTRLRARRRPAGSPEPSDDAQHHADDDSGRRPRRRLRATTRRPRDDHGDDHGVTPRRTTTTRRRPRPRRRSTAADDAGGDDGGRRRRRRRVTVATTTGRPAARRPTGPVGRLGARPDHRHGRAAGTARAAGAGAIVYADRGAAHRRADRPPSRPGARRVRASCRATDTDPDTGDRSRPSATMLDAFLERNVPDDNERARRLVGTAGRSSGRPGATSRQSRAVPRPCSRW